MPANRSGTGAPAVAEAAPAPRPRRKAPAAAAPTELPQACIAAAREAIARCGIEGLSLRDVARRLGVSHQAPYKHYASRDHLLAEVMRCSFEQFAQHLDARQHFDDPRRDLESLCGQYLAYAQQHPLEYRLMFATRWPAAAGQSDQLHRSTHAFDILRGVLRRIHGDEPTQQQRVDLDAMLVWSTMHGLVGVIGGDCLAKLDLPRSALQCLVPHVVDTLVRGLAAGPEPSPARPAECSDGR